MSQPQRVGPGATTPGESERVRLARATRDAALRVPGVVGADAGALGGFMTAAGDGERLEGVTCVAAPGGGYDVSLRLVCDLVALQPLGERVRAAAGKAAAKAGITLGSVSVHVAEIDTRGER
jgi:pimeloyl-ACP methyl ester carboxylesterase